MSLYRCSSGGVSETVLWTNPNPTSAFGNTGIDIADYSSYDYLEFEYKGYKTDTATAKLILSVNEILNHFNANQRYRLQLGYVGDASPWYLYTRNLYKEYSTFAFITSNCFKNASGQTMVTDNDYCIPIKVTGIKYS